MNKLYCAILLLTLPFEAQEPAPKDAVVAISEAFRTHQLVLLGDMHGNVQEHRILINLIRSPNFSQTVSNIVLESMNSLYQPLVDRYVAGENISLDQLQLVWRNGIAVGPVADGPAEELFEAVRKANQTTPAGRPKLRIICGEAAVHWDNVRSKDDLQPFIPNRDQTYSAIVKEQVLAKHQKALLYMGSLHFRRTDGKPSTIEQALQGAGAATYVVLPGSNIVGSYNDLDAKFVQWKWPWMLPTQDAWLGGMPAKPLLMGGNASNAHVSGTLAESGDAFLFLGPRDELKQYLPKRSALEGTPYGKETERRLRIIFGEGRPLPDFLPKDDSDLAPQYAPPHNQGH